MIYEYKGSPGPYQVSVEHDTFKKRPIVRCSLYTDNGRTADGLVYTLASGYGNLNKHFAPNDDAVANFHLFAASPLLLSALIKAVEAEDRKKIHFEIGNAADFTIEYKYPDWYHEAKAAIEQALNLSPENTQP